MFFDIGLLGSIKIPFTKSHYIPFPHLSLHILWEIENQCRHRTMILKPKLEKNTRKLVNGNAFLKDYCVAISQKRDIQPFYFLIYFKYHAVLYYRNGCTLLTADLGLADLLLIMCKKKIFTLGMAQEFLSALCYMRY